MNVQWIVQEVPVKDLAQAMTDFENARTPAGALLNAVLGPPILTYIDITRVLVAWRCSA